MAKRNHNNDPSMLNPNAVRCSARSKHTGKRCKNPAVRGKKVCRLHGGLSLSGDERTEKQKANRPPAAGKVNSGSFKKGNQAARKHGAYTTRLSVEEKERVEQLRADFSLELGLVEELTPFDDLLIKMAAVSLVKAETATLGDAPGRVLLRWHRMGMECLRALRATRATRNKNVFRTPEQTLSVMVEKIRSRMGDDQEAMSEATVPESDVSVGRVDTEVRDDHDARRRGSE